MEAYEKLGAFYLGRVYDGERKAVTAEPVLYDSRDLLTHAFCVGMTGSGKTGLCVSLLEEAAIDGIPAIVIDPKGDLANLLLTFPSLSAADFRPWINLEAAEREGVSPDAYAESQAALWKKGLAEWDQAGERIERLKNAADFAIYTPGSEAGLPVSILGAFSAPPAEILEDKDLLNERITTTATSLLSLLGIGGDPIKSREHILIATILENAWENGRGLDLASLIQAVQTPPVTRVGVLEVESFYPAKDRFELASALNNLLASPGFETWLSGDPLDIDRILYTEKGKPRVAVFYVAHLSDTERMFFVSLLLNQILGWVRTRPGTTSLRALVYMDEIFGYIPPVAEPPSKRPLLTLLKQARAFGFGVVLATQNPVDLDYKALSNIGTWFIGRLQTDRDRERLLDGLEGVNAGKPGVMSREDLSRILAGLEKRVFFLHDVHESAPVVFHSRWAMSYLCGPLTRQQIKQLVGSSKGAAAAARRDEHAPRESVPAPTATGSNGAVSVPRPSVAPAPTAAAPGPAPTGSSRPVLPPVVPETFLPVRTQPGGATVVYRPGLLGIAVVRYTQFRGGPEHAENLSAWVAFEEKTATVDWEKAVSAGIDVGDLEDGPVAGARFASLPPRAASAQSYGAWTRSFADTLYRTRKLELFSCPRLRISSLPGESERDFRVRLSQSGREDRDAQVEKLRTKHMVKYRALEDRLRRAEIAVEREKGQAKQEQVQTAISLGATVLSAFLGRKGRSAIGRATTTARGVGRSARQAQDVARAEAQAQTLRAQLADLQAEFDAEIARLGERLDPTAEPLETLVVKPRKVDIEVKLLKLAWAPAGPGADGTDKELWR
ncbi:MAG: uncharacterized protein H6Q78_378 [Candidatus Krumholzibacteriota bacterium]|nr:uncharacterized protein [Candidatus Krumholzibacteriota bacterium]